MPTTNDVLDQHLKCFGENDLDGVLADYSSDAVFFIPGRPLKGPDAIKLLFQALGLSGPLDRILAPDREGKDAACGGGEKC
jgi:hypothetical protein